jgi:hypothetical protein
MTKRQCVEMETSINGNLDQSDTLLPKPEPLVQGVDKSDDDDNDDDIPKFRKESRSENTSGSRRSQRQVRRRDWSGLLTKQNETKNDDEVYEDIVKLTAKKQVSKDTIPSKRNASSTSGSKGKQQKIQLKAKTQSSQVLLP